MENLIMPVGILLLVLLVAGLSYVLLQGRKRSKSASAAVTAESIQTEEPSKKNSFMDVIDTMEGHEFEYFCAELLKEYGYTSVHVTKASGDQGVDILANKDGARWAFQCKRYSSKLGNTAIQEVNAGRNLYSCFRAVVITNNYFTRGAIEIAKATHVDLWDRDVLKDKIYRLIKREKAFEKLVEDAEKSLKANP